jgi:AI-2 transport protein TqsA
VLTVPPSRLQPPGPSNGVPRGVVVLLGVAAGVVAVAGMKASASLLGPIFLALVVTIAAHPLRIWLGQYLPGWAATVLCLLVVSALLLGLAVSLVLATARFATLLTDYEAEFNELITDLADRMSGLGIDSEQLHTVVGGLDLSKLTDILNSALSGVLGLASGLVLILTLVLFMAVDGASFARQLAAAAQVRPQLVAALTTFAHATRRYLVVSTVFGLVVAVLDTGALALLGIPAPVLWGLLAFLTNYIPNVGFVIGLVPPAALALLEGGPKLMLAVIVVYSVLNLIIQSGIQPKVVGDSVGLSTTLTFISLVFWAWVLGPLGAVLAIPLSLLVRALLVDADPDTDWLRPLVTNRAESQRVDSILRNGEDLDHLDPQ